LDGKPVEDAKSAGYSAVWEDEDRRHKEIGEAIERLSWPITIAKRIALESSLVAVVSPQVSSAVTADSRPGRPTIQARIFPDRSSSFHADRLEIKTYETTIS
jgi:hypothetical protein